ncbi:EAL domain-containing protein [Sulfuriflexus mobilis]|uniref:EAL domain-containing protein n=1 Tax=Sulfuriflexus mobilis TaxID=1811807 RepID=UPI000F82F328|nr:EAL domain-containing protein [Sulfuriflexus mobilis]
MPSSILKKILVIDDDSITRKALVKILNNAGYEIFEADNGNLAINMFKIHTPDLILLDVVMPGMNGYEVCAKLRLLIDYHNLPILMLTGLTDAESVNKAFNAGATDYITKPINWTLLEQRVRYAIRATDMHRSLQTNKAKLEQAQHIAKIGYWEIQLDSNEVVCSSELMQLLNLNKSLNNRPIEKFLKMVHPDDFDRLQKTFINSINNAKPFQIEHRIIRNDGKEMHVQQQTEIIFDINNNPISIIGTLQDISEIKSAKDLISYQQYYDSLTDLPNRKSFMVHSKNVIDGPDHRNEIIVTCLIGVDKLKIINETLGHDAADEVILAYTQRLKTLNSGNNIYISRYKDDSFALLATAIMDYLQVNDLITQITALSKKPIWLGEHEIHISTSIGLSLFPLDNDDFDIILKGAENALNRARDNGGAQAVYYSEKMNRKARARMDIERDIRKGLERDEFVIYYQPQIDIHSGLVSGMEALVRWMHPVKGIILPPAFISVAEESGLIKQLGNVVLRKSCQQTAVWNRRGLGGLRVGVNLSPKQLLNKDFQNEVVSAIKDSGLPPSLLDLEITESMAVKNIKNVIASLKQFQDIGVTISMDDFGTGYSALSYIRQLPINIIKIDRSFVKDIGAGDDGSIAKAVIAMAHSLGKTVIAEGVETEVQLDFMFENGCEEIQGFYFSQPLPADEFEKFVIQHNTLQTRQHSN